MNKTDLNNQINGDFNDPTTRLTEVQSILSKIIVSNDSNIYVNHDIGYGGNGIFFPLKGKALNVRDKPLEEPVSIFSNAENLKKRWLEEINKQSKDKSECSLFLVEGDHPCEYPIKYDKDPLGLDKINDLETLTDMKKYYVDLQLKSTNCGQLDLGIFDRLPRLYEEEIDKINNRINELANPKFLEPIEVEENNGYVIEDNYEWYANNITYDRYLKLKKIWDDDTEMTYEEFWQAFDDEACTEWAKFDRNGNSFCGFWKTDKENAWHLTRQDNCKALYELPHPKKFVLKTVDLGCCTRLECVAFSSYLCEWMSKKVEQMTN